MFVTCSGSNILQNRFPVIKVNTVVRNFLLVKSMLVKILSLVLCVFTHMWQITISNNTLDVVKDI